MPTVSLPLSVVERICAVHKCAADHEVRMGSVLAGVALKPFASAIGAGITIVATDGKVLAEESYPIDLGTVTDAILSEASVTMLRDWCRAVRKSLSKKQHDATVEMLTENRQITVGLPGSPIGDIRLATVEGTFPNYVGALTKPEKSGDGLQTYSQRIGVSSDYLGRFYALWGSKASHAIVMTFARGIIVEPLNLHAGAICQRGLVMPISLPT